MEVTTAEPTARDLPPVVRVAVPFAFGVVTWLVVLLVVGVLASLDTSSILSFVSLFVVGITAWPIYRAAPWRPGVTERVDDWIRSNRVAIPVTVGLAIVAATGLAPGILGDLLTFPFRSAGVLFGAGLFYRQAISPAFGSFLLSFGQWVLEAYWLFVIGTILVNVVRRVR